MKGIGDLFGFKALPAAVEGKTEERVCEPETTQPDMIARVEVSHSCRCPACQIGRMAVDALLGRIVELHGRLGEIRLTECDAALILADKAIDSWRGAINAGSRMVGPARIALQGTVGVRLEAMRDAIREGEVDIESLRDIANVAGGDLVGIVRTDAEGETHA